MSYLEKVAGTKTILVSLLFRIRVSWYVHLVTPSLTLGILSGNVKFRAFIADCKKTYEKTKRGEKHVVIQEIVDTVKQSSGLFLKADDEDWIVVDDAAASYKVGAVFRTLRTLENHWDLESKAVSVHDFLYINKVITALYR